MEIVHFKTNINCGSCVASVKPFLDKEESINNWQVDTTGKDKLLRVSGQDLDPQKIKNLVEQAGFRAELVEE
nr:copper chaperone [Cesiribacter sp. SM1]